MSEAMSHDRLVAKRNIKISEQKELYKRKDPECPIVHFGKHEKERLTLYQHALIDPSEFYRFYSKRYFQNWLGTYAFQIAEKLKHIVPPRKRPGDWVFEYKFNVQMHLLRVKLVKKNKPVSLKPGILRTKDLDITLATDPGRNVKKAFQMMLSLIHAEYFPAGMPTASDLKAFLENEKNFDLCCRENHCSQIPRGDMAPTSVG